jgi:hypothetical protein
VFDPKPLGKIVYIDRIGNLAVNVQGNIIERVGHYIYLGKNISFNNDTSDEIKRRIQLSDRKLPISLKTKVFNQCIMPVLSYGSETWSTTKRLETKLQVTQRAMERIIVGVSKRDKITNINLRKMTGLYDIVIIIQHESGRVGKVQAL